MVIVGLLLVGVFRGQELLTATRVRSIAQQQNELKAAYFGFYDRYRFPPGDSAEAAANIAGVSNVCGASPGNGNGNSRIETVNGEFILAWEHLSRSGFIGSAYTCSGNATVDASSVPRNAYGQFVQLVYDDNYAGVARNQHNLKTGNSMPSHILAEVERKMDDGIATTGTMRGSTYTTGAATDAGCWDAGSGAWIAEPSSGNCGAAVLY